MSDAKKVRASGRGLQPSGVRVGDVADFKIYTEGAGEGNPEVRVIGPGTYPMTYLKQYSVSLSFVHAILKIIMSEENVSCGESALFHHLFSHRITEFIR